MRLPLHAPLFVLALAGCDMLLPGAAPGTVTGVVLYNGQPAAGKRVVLEPAGKRVMTGTDGRYAFTSVGEGTYYVRYTSLPDRPDAHPNEVAEWRTQDFSVGTGGGQSLTPFDVSYNGLLYPGVPMSLIVSETSPVPFHFSPHVQGGRYRVRLTSGANREVVKLLDWSSDPLSIFAEKVEPGTYHWSVEIENHAGTGLSPSRPVDF